MPRKKTATESTVLIGWAAIAKFLGQPLAVAARWAKGGMPVQRKGRYVIAAPDELSNWLGRETSAKEPVHIAQANEADILSSLRLGLKEARTSKRSRQGGAK
jgi:hypothetical protein